MVKAREKVYKASFWILIFLLLLIHSANALNCAGSVNNITANTMYLINNVPVIRSDGRDVIFLDLNGTNITPFFFFPQVSGNMASIYVRFSSNYSTLVILSCNQTAFQTVTLPLYYRPITLTSSTALTNHHVEIVLNTRALILQGKMQSDCRDIRVYDSDFSTLLQYWLEPESCNTPNTRVWVRVPSIPAGTKTIYIAYGNSNWASLSTSAIFNYFVEDMFNTLNSSFWVHQEGTTREISTSYFVSSPSSLRLYYGTGSPWHTDVGTGLPSIASNEMLVTQVYIRNRGNIPWGQSDPHRGLFTLSTNYGAPNISIIVYTNAAEFAGTIYFSDYVGSNDVWRHLELRYIPTTNTVIAFSERNYLGQTTITFTPNTLTLGIAGSYHEEFFDNFRMFKVNFSSLSVTIGNEISSLQATNLTYTPDTVKPSIGVFSVNVTTTSIIVSFSTSDNLFLREYALLLNNETLQSSWFGFVRSANVTLNYSPLILIGKTNPTFTLIVYDFQSNSETRNQAITTVPVVITFIDENRGTVLNFTHFSELYLYLVSRNERIWIYNGTLNPVVQNGTISLAVNATETIRVTWLYKNYYDYYVIEIRPWLMGFYNPIPVGIPGLINNTTIPYLYEFLALSSEEKPVILERANPKSVKLGSTTQYPYDRYKSNSAFLQREVYNVYTIESGTLVFLTAIDGGRAQAVNLDALISAIKPVTMIWGETLETEWLSNTTLRLAYKNLEQLVKPTTIRVYVNDTVVTSITQQSNDFQGIVYFPGFNVSINNNTRIKVEVVRDGMVKITREFQGMQPFRFTIPTPITVILAVTMLIFGLTMLSFESNARYFGLIIAFACIAITTLAQEADFVIRLIQVACLVLIVIFLASRLRGGGT